MSGLVFVSKKCVGMSGLTSGASPARRHEVHAFLARRSVTSSVVDAPFGRTTVKSAHGRFQNPGTKSRLVNTPTTLFNVSTTGRCRSPEALGTKRVSLWYGCTVWANSARLMYGELPVLVNVTSSAVRGAGNSAPGFGKGPTRTESTPRRATPRTANKPRGALLSCSP